MKLAETTALLLDDDAATRAVLARILGDAGVTVFEAAESDARDGACCKPTVVIAVRAAAMERGRHLGRAPLSRRC